MSDNYALDTAARFGDIPFVEFTKELVTGVFDSLVEAHVLQIEEYSEFINSMTQDLSTYINNTQDNVSFDQISDFILNYELPSVDDTQLDSILDALADPANNDSQPINPSAPSAATDTWWGGLINGLAPAVTGLVDKLDDPSEQPQLNAIANYNEGVLSTVPTYKQISDAISTLIVSNKYSLLQTMAKQGMMRLVVTEGEIETKMTFSTWEDSTTTRNTKQKRRHKQKQRETNSGGIFGAFKMKRSKNRQRTITVNTAKSYQRDSSGTKVDVFGRVLVKFKTDYAPLNG
ncbi:hypothetical protein [Marinicellulosiphila megalodicopiae]|uniref:hypothetical protein n=1 Tax=Marinicellulosiphila megalodicopiae TaxID=2724896 RepID=UPI003BB013AD